MEELALKILGPLGLSGLVILVLGLVVHQLYKALQKVNADRLADVPVLIKALENNTQATRENAQAILARNLITEELGRAIERQATVFELFMQKSEMHDEDLRGKMQDFRMVIDASAEAVRNNTAALRDIRDGRSLK